MTRTHLAAVAALSALFVAVAPIHAQGQGNGKGNGKTNGNGKANGGNGNSAAAAATPSQTALPPPTSLAGPAVITTPFAWIDNASVMDAGAVWVGLSVARWQGSGLSEVSVPVIDGAIGLTPRIQLGLSVPRVKGSTDPAGPQGGWGTTFVNAKIVVLQNASHAFNVAVSPTIEVLSAAAVQSPDASRVQWGLPVSLDADRGPMRFYGSGGYFSPGIWFTGAGLGTFVHSRVGISASISRSWATSPLTDPTIPGPHRNEVSGSGSFALTPQVGVFASLGRTFATSAGDGAGTTMSVGVSLTALPSPTR